MAWNCNGIPLDGKEYGNKPHPEDPCSVPDSLDQCPHPGCGLPKQAIVIPSADSEDPKESLKKSPLPSWLIPSAIAAFTVGGLLAAIRIVNKPEPPKICDQPNEIRTNKGCQSKLDLAAQLQQVGEVFYGDLQQHFEDETPATLKRVINSAQKLQTLLKTLASAAVLEQFSPEFATAMEKLQNLVDWVLAQDPQGDPQQFTDEILQQKFDIASSKISLSEKQEAIQSITSTLSEILVIIDPNHDPSFCGIEPERYSFGEQVLFTNAVNTDLELGAREFKSGDYQVARSYFETAIESSPNQPEPRIYFQNTQAHLKSLESGQPHYIIAAAVPIKQRQDSALEMLRGIADAQKIFNDRQQAENLPLLEVQIVNDDNSAEVAKCIAETLVQDQDVLAVIGHNSSNVSQAALPIYAQGDLAMVSPTSTSTQLTGKNFFRTVASDKASGKLLAEYISRDLKASSITVFYVVDDPYSESLKEAFSDYVNPDIQVKLVDISNEEFDVKKIVDDLQESQTQVVALFPNNDNISRAINIIRGLDRGETKVIGGDALYTPQVLKESGNAAEGLILATPIRLDTDYMKTASENWLGQVNWRTASSYDAALAISQVLPDISTRSELIDALRNTVDLSAKDTGGQPLDFDQEGQRQINPTLVQACSGVPSPQGSKLGFSSLNACAAAIAFPTPAPTPSPKTSTPAPPVGAPTTTRPPVRTPAPVTPPPPVRTPAPVTPPPPVRTPAPVIPPPSSNDRPLWGPGSEPALPRDQEDNLF